MPEIDPLSLQGLLRGMTPARLQRLAREVGLNIRGADSAGEIRMAIRSHLADPAAAQKRFAELNRAHQLVLCAVAAAGGGRTGSLPSPGLRDSPHVVHLREICAELSEKGWLFASPNRDYSGERGHVVPLDLMTLIASIGARTLTPGEQRPYFSKRADAGQSAGPEILSTLLRIVGELGREPVRLTQQGGVYRRDLDRLRRRSGAFQFRAASAAFAHIDEALGSLAGQWPGAPWLDEGRDVGMLLWLGMSVGLIAQRNGTLEAQRHGERSLATEGREGLWRKAILSLATLLINSHPAAYCAFELLDRDHWVAPLRWIDDVFNVWLPVRTTDAKCAAAACLLGLAELGMVEAAMDGGEPLLRLSDVGMAIRSQAPLPPLELEDSFRVLPSGDVLVTPYLAPHVQLELERYARPVRVDVVSTYHIEQALVVQQIGDGTPPSRVLDFFTQRASDGIPQPVHFRLDEWMRDVGRVEFLEVALLACDDPDMRERLLALPGVRREALELLGDRWIIIPVNAQERLRNALRDAGIVPVRAVRRPSGLASERALRERRQSSAAYLGRLSIGIGAYAHPLVNEQE